MARLKQKKISNRKKNYIKDNFDHRLKITSSQFRDSSLHLFRDPFRV